MIEIQQAIALHQQGNLADAEVIYKNILTRDRRNFDALHLLGIIYAQRDSFDEAEKLLRRAVAVDANVPPCLHNYGTVLCRLYRFKEAINYYEKAIRLAPDHAAIYLDYGHALDELKRHPEALVAYGRAIALQPTLAAAWVGRGNVFFQLRRDDEALAAFDRALALKPDLASAWGGLSNVLCRAKRYNDALAAYDRALSLNSNAAEVWQGRGNVFVANKQYNNAMADFSKAIELNPDLAEAWHGRGRVFLELSRHDEAFAAFDKARALKQDLLGVEGLRLYTKMHLCDWNHFDAECAQMVSSVKKERATAMPLGFLALSSSPADQLKCVRFSTLECRASDNPIWRGDRYDHKRIRIAYLSADFREHPVSYLLAGMFELHDRARFETTAISFGPNNPNEMLTKLKGSFDLFVDVREKTDIDVAQFIRSHEVDIAVDLMGHTADSRLGILALRPAPIQVSYLGFAGTTGADYIDYILADRLVLPEGDRQFYTEKVVYLPDTFMATDAKRNFSHLILRRADFGLPNSGVVFCAFNNNFKVSPQVFNIWMRLLRKIAGSVLWLSNTNDIAKFNLRREAQERGVDPQRLVFAQRLERNEDHLARHSLADLFLDTFPYNAHATASDALWAGLPVVTVLGDTFAGRVGASLLNAIGLAELVATSPEDYEALALRLAQNPSLLETLKESLTRNRDTYPLFDTGRFTRHIESAYLTMWERQQKGEAPQALAVDLIL